MDIAMKMLKINDSLPEVSAIGLGCMRLAGLEDEKAVGSLIDVCMEEGINFFDHADRQRALPSVPSPVSRHSSIQ